MALCARHPPWREVGHQVESGSHTCIRIFTGTNPTCFPWLMEPKVIQNDPGQEGSWLLSSDQCCLLTVNELQFLLGTVCFCVWRVKHRLQSVKLMLILCVSFTEPHNPPISAAQKLEGWIQWCCLWSVCSWLRCAANLVANGLDVASWYLFLFHKETRHETATWLNCQMKTSRCKVSFSFFAWMAFVSWYPAKVAGARFWNGCAQRLHGSMVAPPEEWLHHCIYPTQNI